MSKTSKSSHFPNSTKSRVNFFYFFFSKTQPRTSRPDNANNKSGGSERVSFAPPARHPVHPPPAPCNQTSLLRAPQTMQTRAAAGGQAATRDRTRRVVKLVSFAPPGRRKRSNGPTYPINPPLPLCAPIHKNQHKTRDRTSLHLVAQTRRTRAATGGRAAMRDRTSLLRSAQTTVVSWRTRRAMEGRQ